MNSFDLREPDLYTNAIDRLQECKDSSISIPQLSSLLGVKSTTLNAKLRRQHISVRTVGRTNFIPGDLARQLVELHKHALIGWPTLRQASEMSGVKSGTIKARCEKGRLESHLDLTKRLRINPAALEGLHLRTLETKPAPNEERVKDPAGPPLIQTKSNGLTDKREAVCLDLAGTMEAPCSSGRGEMEEQGRAIERVPAASSQLPASSLIEAPIESGRERIPPSAISSNSEVIGISARDHVRPEVKNPSNLRVGQTNHRQKECKNLEILIYDPDKPFRISACVIGRSVGYDGYEGKIVGILDDPFSPKIKVRFADHRHPLMQEVLLTVGKRKVAE